MKTGQLFLAAAPLMVGCSDYDLRVEDIPDVIVNPSDPAVVSSKDAYMQIQKPEVDVLWIIDNSCSMGDEQNQVANSFPLFMNFFLGSNLDYHIGVVSTDMDNPAESGKLIKGPGNILWIDPLTPDPVGAFAGMAQLGTNGSGDEQGILAGYAALELQAGHNGAFLREESALHIIVLSDESDYSPDNPITLNEFKDYLNSLRQDPEMVEYHSIVSPANFGQFDCSGVSTPGTRYIEVTADVGGVFWSLCDLPWVGALEAIGLDAAGLKREYFLSQIPVPGTIKVSVDDAGIMTPFYEYDSVTMDGDWVYTQTRNSVTFLEYIPNPGAIVNIEYDVLSSSERE